MVSVARSGREELDPIHCRTSRESLKLSAPGKASASRKRRLSKHDDCSTTTTLPPLVPSLLLLSLLPTSYRPRFRAVNIFGFAVVLRDVFIHRDITKIGRDWSFRTCVSILNASERGLARNKEHMAKENVDLIRRKELTAMNARIFELVRHRRGVRL